MPENSRVPRKDNAFVREIDRLINSSDKTQIDIAEEIGYDNHNMMTMFKRGATRVPLDKVVPLANAVDADPRRLLKMWCDVYMPGALDIFSRAFGITPMTQAERSWIKGLRDAFGDDVPQFNRDLLRSGVGISQAA